MINPMEGNQLRCGDSGSWPASKGNMVRRLAVSGSSYRHPVVGVGLTHTPNSHISHILSCEVLNLMRRSRALQATSHIIKSVFFLTSSCSSPTKGNCQGTIVGTMEDFEFSAGNLERALK